MKIKTQIIFGIFITVILAVIVATIFFVQDTKKIILKHISDEAHIILKFLQTTAEEPILEKDYLTLNKYIKDITKTKGISVLLITDKKGQIIASNDISNIEKNIKKCLPELSSQKKIIKCSYNNKNIEIIKFTKKLFIKNKHKNLLLGTIYIGFDKKYFYDKLKLLYIKAGVIAIIVLIVISFFVFAWVDKLLNPLDTIIKGTEIIGDGDFSHKIKIKQRNEFLILANSFNEMSRKLKSYYDGLLNAFITALHTKDKYSPAHAKRVAKYAVLLGQKLNLSTKQIENIRIASILKDIGNIGVESAILQKKDMLMPDDIIEIQKHPEISAKIIQKIETLKDVVPIILQHHERYDGKGYPKGLKGKEILLEARILSIVDAYDAMISDKEHKKALTKDEAIYELRYNKGKQFDPEITEIFIQLINKEDL